MYEIKADPAKNLLVLRLEGFMTDEQLKEGADQCIAEVKKLKPGFAVINDISGMKPASAKGAEEIKRAQVFVAQNGVGKIIRITSNPISKMQFNRTSKDAGYVALEAKSMADALQLI